MMTLMPIVKTVQINIIMILILETFSGQERKDPPLTGKTGGVSGNEGGDNGEASLEDLSTGNSGGSDYGEYVWDDWFTSDY